MKKIRVIIFIVLVILSFGLTGCRKKQDINELALISAIGFDKTDDGFKLIAQVVNKNILIPNPPQITPVFIVTAEGKTVIDCLADLNDTLTSRSIMINLQLLVFSEEVARAGISEYMHFFVNFTEAQHEYNVLITNGISAESLLGQISSFSMFPTIVIINKLKTSTNEYGFARMMIVEKVVNYLRSDYGSLAISSVAVEGDIEEGTKIDQNKETKLIARIKISDIGIFKDDKLVVWLNKEESTIYNYLDNKIKNTFIIVEGNKNNKISNYLNNVKTKIKVKIENGKPKVSIEIKFSALIAEDTSLLIELDKKYEEEVKNKIIEKLTKQIKDLIEKSKNEFGFDIFGFSEKFYKYEYKWWKQNKEKYDEIFKTMEFEVIIKPTIERLDI